MTRRKGSIVPPRPERGQTTYALRFVCGGRRQYVTTSCTTREAAERELAHVIADVERQIWQPPAKAAHAAPAPSLAELPPGRDPEFDDGFSEYAEAWLRRREGDDLRPRTIESLEWAIGHLSRYFGETPVGAITIQLVDGYRVEKIAERKRGPRGLSNRTLNSTLRVLAQILDDAIEENLLVIANPARGRKRRAKAERPTRSWLEMSQLMVLIDSAGDNRAIVAVMGLAGLRVSEAMSLRWSAVDVANGRIRVVASKTDAGRREIEMMPLLRDELLALKARTADTSNEALVFPAKAGGERSRHSVRDALHRAMKAANVKLEAARQPVIEHATNHSLRRTYCAIRFASGATLPEVIASMGHTSPTLSLSIYSKVLVRQNDTTSKADKMLREAFRAVSAANRALDPFDQALAGVLGEDERSGRVTPEKAA